MERLCSSDVDISNITLDQFLDEDDISRSLQYLPEEIIENILSFLSPYKEMQIARLVSKQWCRIIKSIIKHRRRRFYNNLSNCNVKWLEVVKEAPNKTSERNLGSHITDRFSHCAAYLNGSMYVFGGCTSTNTTFNDLWTFDLASRKWIRPVAMGAYPSPKACATMVVYNGNLVLFGGWSHPIPYPLHQSAHYFSELHVYSPASNKWSHILSLGTEPEALGGHSASVAGHLMVVFGGSPRPGQGTNDVWVFDFLKASWKMAPIWPSARPEPRYGQFQTTLSDKHILIMGGCVGPNRPYNDLWLLEINQERPWVWWKIKILNPEWSASQTWCHGACRVQERIIVISKCLKPRQAKNIKPNIFVSNPKKTQTNVQVQPQTDATATPSDATASLDAESQGLSGGNLLALQRKLHRECVNLPDPDNHHHNPSSSQPEPEGNFLRIQNRWVLSPPKNQAVKPVPSQQQNQQTSPFQPQNQQQSHNIDASSKAAMPSIRPNANSNRQRQLEALQRQEEILRSKSRALAASRNLAGASCSAQNSCDLTPEEQVPDIIQTKNKMDVHVLDISRVISHGEAEWKPLSELQAPGAPTETICCSLLEGRGELVMFGGVIRESTSPVTINTAINKLYLLHA